MKLSTVFVLGTLIGMISCTSIDKKSVRNTTETIKNPTNKVVKSSEIQWEKLNAARGDKSPLAGTIWGDRKGTVSTGFVAKFVDGFSSPPHIHNVTYRAVVIKGLIHNADPKATDMWMTPGSFWTQPVGAAHITSAKGQENMAYVEIDRGPYLVQPTSDAFENEERPINVDASNIIWLNSSRTNWIEGNSKAELSFLWESKKNDGLKGLFIKIPSNFEGELHTNGKIVHAIIIQGELNYTMPKNKEVTVLDPTSYFGSTAKAIHSVSNKGKEDCLIYIRTNGEIYIK